MDILAHQLEFRQEIPDSVYGTLDYREFRDRFIKIDEVLTKSNLEHTLASKALEKYFSDHATTPQEFHKRRNIASLYKMFRYAVRCNLARHLTGESYRAFSIKLADSCLFQWFTRSGDFGSNKAISKSSLERYEKYFDQEQVSDAIKKWLATLLDAGHAEDVGLNNPLDFASTFTDATCVKANIHFPVDWVLFRDAARSFLLAIKTIRKQGLKHRMTEPSVLSKNMNNLCIKMTHTKGNKDSKKKPPRLE